MRSRSSHGVEFRPAGGDLRNGVLIAIEGIDGAGKTTQVAALAAAIRQLGLEVVTTKEPTDGPAGRRIRETARTGRLPPGDELALFVEDRKEHVRALIGPALERGAVVIVDRYYYSTAAYQGARGLDPDSILTANEAFAPRPDLVVVVDVDPALGVGRVRARDQRENLFEDEADLRRSRAIFQDLSGPHIWAVDGAPAIDLVRRRILRRVVCGPIRRLLGDRVDALCRDEAIDDAAFERLLGT